MTARSDLPAKLDAAEQRLATIKTVADAKALGRDAEAVRVWAKKAGKLLPLQNHAALVKILAERRAGELLAQIERSKGGRGKTRAMLAQVYEANEIAKRTGTRWQVLAGVPEADIRQLEIACNGSGDELTSAMLHAQYAREAKRRAVRDQLEDVAAQAVKKLLGTYDTIVIDPPWPMQKIERDVTPQQVEFDYPVMTEEQLRDVPVPQHCAPDTHVWVWAAQHFLPVAFRLLDAWRLTYVCTFVWHKPGGFQPWNLPQFNCEFALYARHGSPTFLDTTDFLTCFNAPRQGHSAKPDHFYDVVRRVTAGRRLDMFNRRAIPGFDGWGQQAAE
jgi:N6-adenosine-specific RNA methylase IME4